VARRSKGGATRNLNRSTIELAHAYSSGLNLISIYAVRKSNVCEPGRGCCDRNCLTKPTEEELIVEDA
jgi:hypothetical protein